MSLLGIEPEKMKWEATNSTYNKGVSSLELEIYSLLLPVSRKPALYPMNILAEPLLAQPAA